jgi:hypothetical protein
VIVRSLEIIDRFLSEELVYPSGGTLSLWYDPWPLTSEEALFHIEREWRALDRALITPDVVVFRGTDTGARLALALWPDEFDEWRGTKLTRRFPDR